jgi:hypothetical protein
LILGQPEELTVTRIIALAAMLAFVAGAAQAQPTGVTTGGSVGGSTGIGTGATGTTNTPGTGTTTSGGAGTGTSTGAASGSPTGSTGVPGSTTANGPTANGSGSTTTTR